MRAFIVFTLLLPFISYSQSPTGDIKGPFQWTSKIYPGTQRQYWVYVPKQYDASKPACLMVVQDGLSRATGWKLPTVLDSLIAIGKIPVMIGVFVDHGMVKADLENANPRYNRSFEYDALGDRYARFLMEELLPEVQRSYNISANPNDRSIAGASSGAICAFNVAWERPDQFRRVLSTIGTYVGLRGGDEFVTLVRKTEAKPLRVYLQDGNQDLNIYAGDWWMANQSMLSALTYAGYEVNHSWGNGGHDSKHAVAILAESLSWLWKDYPAPVTVHKGVPARMNLLVDNEVWNEILMKEMKVTKIAVNKSGDVFFIDKQSVYRVDKTHQVKPYANLKAEGDGICAVANDLLYVSLPGKRKIVSVNSSGQLREEVLNCDGAFLCSSERGLYFSDAVKNRIGFYAFDSKKVIYVDTPFRPSGLSISSEKTFLNVASENTLRGYSYQIMRDGSLEHGQEYVHYHLPYEETVAGQGGMTVDSENLLYTATSLGVQVADQLGRVNFIFSRLSKAMVDVKLGGPEFNVLFASADGRLYARKISAKGIPSWGAPVNPPKPGL